MIELADEFSTLSPDYQKVIQLAQEIQKIKVIPLQELKGGQTGANLYLVSVSSLESQKVQHLVLKLDHKNSKSKMDELERHLIAVNQSTSEFANNHIADISFNRIEQDSSVAIFYNIAGQSLHNYKRFTHKKFYLPGWVIASNPVEILRIFWKIFVKFIKTRQVY